MSPKGQFSRVILRNQADPKILPEEPTGTIIMSDTVDWFGQKQGGAHLIEAGIGGEHVYNNEMVKKKEMVKEIVRIKELSGRQ